MTSQGVSRKKWKYGCAAFAIAATLFLGINVWIASDFWYSGPELPPKEENRVAHPAGFSVIAPTGWRRQIVNADAPIAAGRQIPRYPNDGIRIVPDSKARLTEMLVIYRIGAKLEDQDVRNAKPARQNRFQLQTVSTFEEQRGKFWVWFALFPDPREEAYHYELSLWLPNDDIDGQESVPDAWWPYLNSFRMELPLTTKGEAQPTGVAAPRTSGGKP